MRFESEGWEHIHAAVNLMWWLIYNTGNRISPSRGKRKETKLYDSARISQSAEGRGEFRDGL